MKNFHHAQIQDLIALKLVLAINLWTFFLVLSWADEKTCEMLQVFMANLANLPSFFSRWFPSPKLHRLHNCREGNLVSPSAKNHGKARYPWHTCGPWDEVHTSWDDLGWHSWDGMITFQTTTRQGKGLKFSEKISHWSNIFGKILDLHFFHHHGNCVIASWFLGGSDSHYD